MSGFSGGGGMGSQITDLVRQVQGNPGTPTSGQTPATAPPAQPGVADPAAQAQGQYNTLANDMSQGRIAPYSFAGNRFQYSPGGKGVGGGAQPASPFGGPMYGQPQNPYGGYQQRPNPYASQNPYSNYRPLPFGSIRPQIHMANPYGYGNDYSEGSYNAMNMANTARWR